MNSTFCLAIKSVPNSTLNLGQKASNEIRAVYSLIAVFCVIIASAINWYVLLSFALMFDVGGSNVLVSNVDGHSEHVSKLVFQGKCLMLAPANFHGAKTFSELVCWQQHQMVDWEHCWLFNTRTESSQHIWHFKIKLKRGAVVYAIIFLSFSK